MKTIRIKSMLGKDTGISTDEGERIYNVLYPLLQAGEKVELDFQDITLLTTPFLHAVAGKLIHAFKAEELEENLSYRNTSPKIEARLQKILETSHTHLHHPEPFDLCAHKAFNGE
ncbi:hypothetical protein FACS189440_06800 [Bacteroidia bacterium]|nr:hypothetical protein FACS189440_06800 [Bacteroidia bacterium]